MEKLAVSVKEAAVMASTSDNQIEEWLATGLRCFWTKGHGKRLIPVDDLKARIDLEASSCPGIGRKQ